MSCVNLNEVATSYKMIKEAKALDEVWSNTIKSVGDITDSFKRACVCLLLENQRLVNECFASESSSDLNKRLIDLVAETFPNLLAWNLISIQPLLNPTGIIYYLCRKLSSVNNEQMFCIESEDVSAKTGKLNRQVADDFGPKDVARSLIEELDTEFLTDLYNNCATVEHVNLKKYKVDKAVRLEEALESVLKAASENMYASFGTGKPNWMVVNDIVYKQLKQAFDSIGLCKNISIYQHRAIGGILIGRKGESYMDSGYVYSPYVPFTLTPSTTRGIFWLLTRYGKKLLKNGASYYSRVNIIDDVS